MAEFRPQRPHRLRTLAAALLLLRPSRPRRWVDARLVRWLGPEGRTAGEIGFALGRILAMTLLVTLPFGPTASLHGLANALQSGETDRLWRYAQPDSLVAGFLVEWSDDDGLRPPSPFPAIFAGPLREPVRTRLRARLEEAIQTGTLRLEPPPAWRIHAPWRQTLEVPVHLRLGTRSVGTRLRLRRIGLRWHVVAVTDGPWVVAALAL